MIYAKAVKNYNAIFDLIKTARSIHTLSEMTKGDPRTVISRIKALEALNVPIIKTRDGKDKRATYYRLGCTAKDAWSIIERGDSKIRILRAPTRVKQLTPNKTPWFIITDNCANLYK